MAAPITESSKTKGLEKMEQNINIKYSEKENFKLIFHFKELFYDEEEQKKYEDFVTKKIKAFHRDSLIIFEKDLEIHIIQK